MSRIGKKPIAVPAGVKINVADQMVNVEGPKGKLKLAVHDKIKITQKDGQIQCDRSSDEKVAKSLHGLFRTLISNMIDGVVKGFEKRLEIVGVGYGAAITGKTLALTVGFSKPVKVEIPANVTCVLAEGKANELVISGCDKQAVGQFAAEVRKVRKPEPYKGTGIKYQGEKIVRKSGKAFGAGGK